MPELNQKLLDKMRGLNLWSLATVTEDNKPWVRYVVPTGIDDDLTIWVATFTSSRKVAQIRVNPEVHLTMGMGEPAPEGSYLQVQAEADIVVDQEKKNRNWHDQLRTYFSGPEDPEYVLLKLTPYRIEYNDMKVMEPEIWER